jgi:hypothetical protein
MRRILFLALMAVALMVPDVCRSQVAQYRESNPLITTSGSFTQPAQYRPLSATGSRQQFPWYTRRDTVNNTGADTFNQVISSRQVSSVYTWAVATQISGTNTSCTVRLWASADSGVGVSWIPLYTATVSATNPVGYHVVNDGAIFPYRRLRWVFTGVGTHSTWWYCGLYIQ